MGNKPASDYGHPDHGEMEWVDYDTIRDRDIKGWRCKRCHVIGHPDRADDVFDGHNCDEYKEIQESITGML